MLSSLRYVLIVAFSAATAASARAEETDERSLSFKYPGVWNDCGVIVLDDQKAFEAIMTQLQEEDNASKADDADAALDAFEDYFKFFSLRRYLDALEESEVELTPDVDHVYDDYLATLVNPGYQFVIGRSEYVDRKDVSGYILTADITYEIKGIEACHLAELKDINNIRAAGFEVISHVNDPNKGSGGKRNLQVTPCDGWQGCTAYTEYANSQRRFKGRIWVQNYPFLATVGTRTKHYKRKSNGKWKKEKADEIWALAAIRAANNPCTITSSGSLAKTKFNKKKAQDVAEFWNQVTKANAMVGTHGARDLGVQCERGNDLFNCNTDTLVCGNEPPVSDPPSCMSGDAGIVSTAEKSVKAVENLQIGEAILGLDENMKKTESCTVEAKGYFGRGPVYGNYTHDHYVLSGDAVSSYGINQKQRYADKYAVLTSCPVGLDESGVGFTGLAEVFFGSSTKAVKWSDYVLIHKSILKLVRGSGSFWFSPSTYISMDVVGKYTPALYATMLDCAKDASTCSKFEEAAALLVSNALAETALEMAYIYFPDLGRTGAEGSVSAALYAK